MKRRKHSETVWVRQRQKKKREWWRKKRTLSVLVSMMEAKISNYLSNQGRKRKILHRYSFIDDHSLHWVMWMGQIQEIQSDSSWCICHMCVKTQAAKKSVICSSHFILFVFSHLLIYLQSFVIQIDETRCLMRLNVISRFNVMLAAESVVVVAVSFSVSCTFCIYFSTNGNVQMTSDHNLFIKLLRCPSILAFYCEQKSMLLIMLLLLAHCNWL